MSRALWGFKKKRTFLNVLWAKKSGEKKLLHGKSKTKKPSRGSGGGKGGGKCEGNALFYSLGEDTHHWKGAIEGGTPRDGGQIEHGQKRAHVVQARSGCKQDAWAGKESLFRKSERGGWGQCPAA